MNATWVITLDVAGSVVDVEGGAPRAWLGANIGREGLLPDEVRTIGRGLVAKLQKSRWCAVEKAHLTIMNGGEHQVELIANNPDGSGL
jgi:hypothetical protein